LMILLSLFARSKVRIGFILIFFEVFFVVHCCMVGCVCFRNEGEEVSILT
jgi:hypothetical protein